MLQRANGEVEGLGEAGATESRCYREHGWRIVVLDLASRYVYKLHHNQHLRILTKSNQVCMMLNKSGDLSFTRLVFVSLQSRKSEQNWIGLIYFTKHGSLFGSGKL